jgi:hypothetical protein
MRILTALLALQLSTCLAQTSSTISLSNGIRLKITANTGTNASDNLKVEMKPATGNSVYRILRDDTGLAVWAYEPVVDRLPDGDHFQIIAKPAGNEFAAEVATFSNDGLSFSYDAMAIFLGKNLLGQSDQVTYNLDIQIAVAGGSSEIEPEAIDIKMLR